MKKGEKKNDDKVEKVVKVKKEPDALTKPVEVDVEVEAVVSEVDRYPFMRRMLNSLDKFLSKSILSVTAIYFFGIALCFAVVMLGGAVNASSGGNGLPVLDAWMYALAATITLVFVLLLVRFIAVKRKKKLEKSQ